MLRAKRVIDEVVVLGEKINSDGTISFGFAQRIDIAVRICGHGSAGGIIFTGGATRKGFPSEAERAYEYAKTHGLSIVPTARTESESRSTFENMRFAREMFADDIENVTVVGPALMEKRVQMLKKRLWPDSITMVYTPYDTHPSWFERLFEKMKVLATWIDTEEGWVTCHFLWFFRNKQREIEVEEPLTPEQEATLHELVKQAREIDLM